MSNLNAKKRENKKTSSFKKEKTFQELKSSFDDLKDDIKEKKEMKNATRREKEAEKVKKEIKDLSVELKKLKDLRDLTHIKKELKEIRKDIENSKAGIKGNSETVTEDQADDQSGKKMLKNLTNNKYVKGIAGAGLAATLLGIAHKTGVLSKLTEKVKSGFSNLSSSSSSTEEIKDNPVYVILNQASRILKKSINTLKEEGISESDAKELLKKNINPAEVKDILQKIK